MRRVLALIIVGAFLSITPASADTKAGNDTYRTFLIPIFVDGPGAHKSIWNSELWIYNRSDDPVESALYWYNDDWCRLGAPCPEPIPPHALFEPPIDLYFWPRGRTGLLFHPSAEGADELSFSLRVKDVAHDATSAGVEIPIVAEEEFAELLVLLNVPKHPRYRTTLRLYALGQGATPVRILYRSMDSDEVLAEEQVVLVSAFPENTYEPPLSPLFAELADLTVRYPALSNIDNFRVECRSESDRLIWGFLSITNNETGQVTIVTP